MTKSLQQTLIEEFGKKTIDSIQIPDHITKNLNSKFILRPYQVSCLKLFLQYNNSEFPGKSKTNHQLVFHMATGSGKTLIMASLILQLYSQGYRNFLFFVNSTNIIEKTKENFLNKSSSKYLFADKLLFRQNPIDLNLVNNFEMAKKDAINIAFTTIQSLHSQMLNPRENGLTFDDFKTNKIVLISDEAHHINVETKSAGKKAKQNELIESANWETTVDRIFEANNENMLLEFTATIDFSEESLENKYIPKLIYDYPLREFRHDGYSKEIYVLQNDSDEKTRMIQALLMSQYRKKVFLKNGIQAKPVILFKSKTISESEASANVFNDLIERLQEKDLKEILESSQVSWIKNFWESMENVSQLENLVIELKEDFSESRILSVNSKNDSDEKQLIVNSLEDSTNQYRAIFAVDQLNEGWDVLNLFDIVRLYDTRDARANKPGTTTMKEAQLIGRGARYFPFEYQGFEEKYKRKFDSDIDNEMRICETMIYHSSYNPKYIQELNTALQEIGIVSKDTIIQEFELKEDFLRTSIYRNGFVYLNSKVKRSDVDVLKFEDYVYGRIFKANLATGMTKVSTIFDLQKEETSLAVERKFDCRISDFPVFLVRKAINQNPDFVFSRLNKAFPNLNSVVEFIESKDFLANIKVELSSKHTSLDMLSVDEKLEALRQVFVALADCLFLEKHDSVGTTNFRPVAVKDILRNKKMIFSLDDSSDREFGVSMKNSTHTRYPLNLDDCDWFVFKDLFGTSEEKQLVIYLHKKISTLREKYKNIYLIRNEKFFKIFNFVDGRAFEPDFILFMEEIGSKAEKVYQIFIEPKGSHLLALDAWKEDFLKSLKERANVVQLIAGVDYSVWGLPFFNSSYEDAFDRALIENFLEESFPINKAP